MSKIVFAAIAISVNLATFPAYAGCIGAGVGDGCIGIPTQHEHPYRYDDHDRDQERHHDMRRHRDHHDEDDED